MNVTMQACKIQHGDVISLLLRSHLPKFTHYQLSYVAENGVRVDEEQIKADPGISDIQLVPGQRFGAGLALV